MTDAQLLTIFIAIGTIILSAMISFIVSLFFNSKNYKQQIKLISENQKQQLRSEKIEIILKHMSVIETDSLLIINTVHDMYLQYGQETSDKIYSIKSARNRLNNESRTLKKLLHLYSHIFSGLEYKLKAEFNYSFAIHNFISEYEVIIQRNCTADNFKKSLKDSYDEVINTFQILIDDTIYELEDKIIECYKSSL